MRGRTINKVSNILPHFGKCGHGPYAMALVFCLFAMAFTPCFVLAQVRQTAAMRIDRDGVRIAGWTFKDFNSPAAREALRSFKDNLSAEATWLMTAISEFTGEEDISVQLAPDGSFSGTANSTVYSGWVDLESFQLTQDRHASFVMGFDQGYTTVEPLLIHAYPNSQDILVLEDQVLGAPETVVPVVQTEAIEFVADDGTTYTGWEHRVVGIARGFDPEPHGVITTALIAGLIILVLGLLLIHAISCAYVMLNKPRQGGTVTPLGDCAL